MRDLFTPATGRLRVDVYRSGVLIERDDGRNKVVNLARIQMARLLGGDAANRSVTRIGVGVNGLPPTKDDAGISGAYIKDIDGVSYPTSTSVEFAFTLGSWDANLMNIMEFGLFTTGGVLVARRVRLAPLLKSPDISLSGSWKLEF